MRSNSSDYLDFISRQKRRRCLLVILNSVNNGSNPDLMEVISQEADNLNRNLMFYIHYQEQWVVMIKVKNTDKTVVNDLKIFEDKSIVENSWDLQGLTVQSISLNWMPDYALYGCTKVMRTLGDI